MIDIVTHNGIFHADEVTACALIKVFIPSLYASPIRTRDPELIAEAKIVVDVGGIYDPMTLRFDHHQVSYEGPLSSAGMMLNSLENNVNTDCSGSLAKFLRNQLIDGVDAIDNGKAPKRVAGFMDFSGVISSFNHYAPFSAWQDRMFNEAVDFVCDLLRRLKAQHKRFEAEKVEVDTALDGCTSDILELPRFLNWQNAVVKYNADAAIPLRRVIWPQQDEWRVQVPPKELGSFELGASPLTEENPPADLVFVHKNGFIGSAKSKEGALQLAS